MSAVARDRAGHGTSAAAPRAARPPVQGAVSISGPVDYIGMDTGAAGRRRTVPQLVVRSEYDGDIAAARAAVAASRAKARQLLVVPGGERGRDFFQPGSKSGDKVIPALLAFRAQQLR